MREGKGFVGISEIKKSGGTKTSSPDLCYTLESLYCLFQNRIGINTTCINT